MKVLLTGATGYIGKRLLPVLVEQGHEVVCCVRDKNRFNPSESVRARIQIIEVDLLNAHTLEKIPTDIDGAFYLVHSMSSSGDYAALEKKCALNFRERMNKTQVKHVIYLSGIVNEKSLSPHLTSRKNVEIELKRGTYNFTSIRSGIIIGTGSASFEIIRDLVEKLPIMIAPKWLKTKSQPIGITDIIRFLNQSLFNTKTYNQEFDVGGPDVFSYKDILDIYGKARGLKRTFIIVPVMTPRLSSYWLYFVTSTAYELAVALVDSMKVEVVCKDKRLQTLLDIQPEKYEVSLRKAFSKIQSNQIVSSWKDSLVRTGQTSLNISDFIRVPKFGCYKDVQTQVCPSRSECLDRIWQIGGETGWYYANLLWRFRGFIDKIFGGVGLRRGRTNKNKLAAGDVVDFWRVLYANKKEGKLLLFAEMKLPGEAWLEFKMDGSTLIQTATFRPIGLLGRLYWFSVLPFHSFIFKGMIKELTGHK